MLTLLLWIIGVMVAFEWLVKLLDAIDRASPRAQAARERDRQMDAAALAKIRRERRCRRRL
jgi:beta-lactamase regulating signal transducer with metallopeptidase domain